MVEYLQTADKYRVQDEDVEGGSQLRFFLSSPPLLSFFSFFPFSLSLPLFSFLTFSFSESTNWTQPRWQVCLSHVIIIMIKEVLLWLCFLILHLFILQPLWFVFVFVFVFFFFLFFASFSLPPFFLFSLLSLSLSLSPPLLFTPLLQRKLGDSVSVKFEDDENENGRTPSRKVESRHVFILASK